MNGPSALSGDTSCQLVLPRDPQDAELVVLAAFRYALGRKTYIVPVIAEWLRQVMPSLRLHLCDLIAREIDAAEAREGLGDGCDAVEWLAVRGVARSAIGPSAQSGSATPGVRKPAQKRRGEKRGASPGCEAPKPVDNC